MPASPTTMTILNCRVYDASLDGRVQDGKTTEIGLKVGQPVDSVHESLYLFEARLFSSKSVS